MNAIGVDIGGTKIAAALIEDNGTFYNRIEEATKTEDSETLFDQVVALIQRVLDETKVDILQLKGIGLGVPGKVDHMNGVALSQNNIPWPNFPIVDRLSKVFPGVSIVIDNDVKVAAVAEQTVNPQTAKESTFTYITISTGIASASIIDSKIVRGSGFTGEIGFYPVRLHDGSYVRLEEFASGPGIQRAGNKLIKEGTSTAEVFDKYHEKDERAVAIIEERAKATAEAIYAHIMILDPQVIVLGGSVINYQPVYVERIKAYLKELIVPEQVHILDNIMVSEIGGHNGIIGAGCIAIENC